MVTNLFFIHKRQIAVFALCDGKLTPFLKDSQMFFDIEENFWNWWKVRSQYQNGDETDLCFVWDEKNPLVFEDRFFAPKLSNTLWRRESVELVLKEIGFSACIQDSEGEFVGEEEGVKFLTNTNLKKETEMYRYYRELNEHRERARQKFAPKKREPKLCETKTKKRIQGDMLTENKEFNQ